MLEQDAGKELHHAGIVVDHQDATTRELGLHTVIGVVAPERCPTDSKAARCGKAVR